MKTRRPSNSAATIDGTALVEAARAARRNAYAPYSHYDVGAAALTEAGTIFTGANVENASYGLSMCAERVAIFGAVAAGHRSIRAVAVVTGGAKAAPCGACRQVMAEFGVETVFIAGQTGTARARRFAELLPDAFTAADLTPSG